MTAGQICETGDPYVPDDYHGQIGGCEVCGHPAPARPRATSGKVECSPCWIGGIAVGVASPGEAANLIQALHDETGKEPAPWRPSVVGGT